VEKGGRPLLGVKNRYVAKRGEKKSYAQCQKGGEGKKGGTEVAGGRLSE